MKKALLLLLFSLYFIQVNGQDSTAGKACHTLNTRQHGFYLFPFYYCQSRTFQVDGEGRWKHVGMFGDTLKSYLHPSSGAYDDMKKYKQLRIAGVVQMWGLGLGSHIACIAIISSSDSPTLPASAGVLLAAGWGFYISGAITYHVLAKKHYFNALRHHRSYCRTEQTYTEPRHQPSYMRIGSASAHPGICLSYHF